MIWLIIYICGVAASIGFLAFVDEKKDAPGAAVFLASALWPLWPFFIVGSAVATAVKKDK